MRLSVPSARLAAGHATVPCWPARIFGGLVSGQRVQLDTVKDGLVRLDFKLKLSGR